MLRALLIQHPNIDHILEGEYPRVERKVLDQL